MFPEKTFILKKLRFDYGKAQFLYVIVVTLRKKWLMGIGTLQFHNGALMQSITQSPVWTFE